jgi:flavin reductase (DIM6/NTAB) family NADH-FMN oxidoreductase RutF
MSENASNTFNERGFRDALGFFATGVAIVTAQVGDEKLGATVSSFNSVSLNPPLVLFSLTRTSFGIDKWKAASAFAISILDEEQISISNRFARGGDNKWAGLNIRQAGNGAPLPPGAIVHFECCPYAVYDGGDHEIFVCEVTGYHSHHPKRQPLVFYSGKYRHLDRHGADLGPPLDNSWLHGW